MKKIPTIFLVGLSTIFLATVAFFRLFRNVVTHRKRNGQVHLPPGPARWPVIGNLPELLRNKPAFRWILGLVKEMNTNIACFRFHNVHVIVVNCPEISYEFLKKQDAVFASRPITMATEYSSHGFRTIAVVPWGEQWKRMRRAVASQVLTTASFRCLLKKRLDEADNLVRYLYNQCKSLELERGCGGAGGGAVVDVRVAVRQYSGNVIRKMMFNRRYFGEGREDGGPGKEEEEHVDAAFTVLSLLYAFCLSDYVPWLRWLDFGGHEKGVKKAIKVINKYHDPIIDLRIEKWRGSKDDECIHKEEPEDLLDALILIKDADGKPLLSTEEIKAQTAELMYAAVDNPSNAVEWAMAEMLNQPHILQKAVEEIDNVVGKERLVQESDFSKLNYVKACIREAFRLHPIAPFNLPHVSNADTIVAGYLIPKGSHVLLSRVGLGRNPKVWDEPLRFNLERHLMMDGKAKVELTEPELRFISFSTGRRGCMGVSTGTAMTVMLLARLLQGFTWNMVGGEPSIDLSEGKNDLFLANPLRLHARPRMPVHLYPTC